MRRCLDISGLGPPSPNGALIMLAIRPWLSMRKYGERGYLYTQLDAGHLAANILGHLTCAGIEATARLRMPRRPLADLLGLGSRCREIHSVLSMEPGGPLTAGAAASRGWQVRDARSQRNANPHSASEDISWLELECWRSLPELFADDPPQREWGAPANGSANPRAVANGAAASGAVTTIAVPTGAVADDEIAASADRRSPLAGALVRLRPGLPTGTPFPPGARWDALSRSRSSCKRFLPEPITSVQLFGILSAVLTPVITDIPGDAALQATLISRHVSGMPDGIYRLTDGPYRVADPPAADEIVPACMQQEHLKDAAALVLFHVARDELLGHRPTRMRELLFRAGALGQLLYLGAAGAGVGVTAVGGFDARRWAHLGQLSAGQEVLYILMFGHDVGTGIKRDRLTTAYAHGEQ